MLKKLRISNQGLLAGCQTRLKNPEVWLNLSKAFRLGKELKKVEMMALEAS